MLSSKCLTGLRLPALILWAAMLCLAPLGVNAHPHSWVDVKSYVDGKEQQIKGIGMVWQFDPMTSAYMLEGENLEASSREQTLARMAQDIVNNIREFSYFTQVTWEQQPVALAGASKQRLSVQGLNVSLSFYLTFKEPIPLQQGHLDVQVFDPSYYIDMAWRSATDLELAIELQAACSKSIEEPKPSPEQISYALALPADAAPDQELGKLFTQQGLISCELP